MDPTDDSVPCPCCHSKGFEPSEYFRNMCTFCDGTEGGQQRTDLRCEPDESLTAAGKALKAELMFDIEKIAY